MKTKMMNYFFSFAAEDERSKRQSLGVRAPYSVGQEFCFGYVRDRPHVEQVTIIPVLRLSKWKGPVRRFLRWKFLLK